jgi:hypothetical protein
MSPSNKSFIISIISYFNIILSLNSLTSAKLADFMSDSVSHYPSIFENPKIYNVGAVLSSGDNIFEFSQVSLYFNYWTKQLSQI